jgi:glycosyltransferase involved in cell wall biosynthesis
VKILFVIHSLGGGGAERVTATLASHWQTSGHEVVVVTLAPLDEDSYPLASGVRRVALDAAADSKGVWGATVANLNRVKALRAVLRRERPDVAIGMMSTSNVLLALAAPGLSIRTVGSERIHPARLDIGVMWSFLRARFYRLLDAVVVQTAKSGSWVLANTSARHVEVIPNPVVWPLAPRRPFVDARKASRQKRLLAAGRLEHQKGFDMLIDVFSRLAAEHPEWELVIVGEGTLRVALEAQARQTGLDSIRIPGLAGNLTDWYESADIFVCSSRFEGFPNALLEAMAHGCPSVSFACDTGPEEIIHHDVDGVLVPPEDQRQLQLALADLMSDEAARQRLGRSATTVRERFSIGAVSEMWMRLLAHPAH